MKSGRKGLVTGRMHRGIRWNLLDTRSTRRLDALQLEEPEAEQTSSPS
jgi:hypothetical protein